MKRRILTVILAMIMVFSLASVAFAGTSAPLKGQIVILHTNDIHARASENMGYAAVAALKKAYEDQGAEVLLFDAGDALHGKPIATLFKGKSIVNIMNKTGYDLMVPGNHDFNYGYKTLAKYVYEDANFTMLASNVVFKSNGTYLFDQNKVFEINGRKIGVFGLCTPETSTKTNPNNVLDIEFQNPIDIAKTQVYRLQQKGCDLIICVGHIGVDAGSVFTSEKICKAVKGIDIFVDGHSHTTLEKGEKVNGTVIVQTGTELKNIGVVTINGDKITAGLVTADDFKGSDAKVAALVGEYNAIVDEAYDTAVGATSVELNGNRAPGVRTMETNLSDLSADAMLYAAKKSVAKVDCAITNGGGIRTTVEVGQITKKKMVEVFPFGNTVCTLQIPGSVLLEVLEANCKDCPEANGGFPCVSGLTFTIDTTKTYVAGQINRVKDVKVNGEALEPTKIYTVATNDFLAVGGDLYAAFANYEAVNAGIGLEDALIDYIATVQNGTVGSEYAEPQGRITIIK